ncbi:MAG: beta-propeller fold lactonase family protein [Lachnospiraceae bacterium]|nr:beta-propeller fold lactonase family protein [Lachnospiraceae bacterium]
MADKYVAYVGTYTHENSVGIYVYDLDPDTGILKERSVAPINNPSYLCLSYDGHFLYSIADEGVASFSVDENGDLTRINQKWIGGMRGCFVDIDHERRYLFVGGFHDGRVTMMALNPDGSVGEIADGIFHQGVGVSATERRLDHPKVSCVKLTPDEKFLCAADYGLNQVKVYRVDYKRGKLHLEDIIRTELDAAPRALRFSKDGKYCYILNEQANTIEVYTYEVVDDEPVFNQIQVAPVMDEEFMTAASSNLGLSWDDKYIYVAIDGLNGVSCMERNLEDGTLKFKSNTLISGDYPKTIAVLPGNKFYVVLNHDTNDIRSFEIYHDKGYCLMKNPPVHVNKPNCIRILNLSNR